MADHEAWVGVTHANVDFTFPEYEHVMNGAPVVRFTATPTKLPEEMHVQPSAGLQLSIEGFPYTDAVALLAHLENHVRHWVVGMHFHYGLLPPDPSSYSENDPA